MLTIFGTGHRPEDAGGLSVEDMHLLCCTAIAQATTPITTIISGAAAGFDLAIAQAAVFLNINLIIAKPWAGHKFRVADRGDWGKILSYPRTTLHVVNESEEYPGPGAYQDRNRWMVDNANAGLALWNGKLSGGTYNCLKYAESVHKPVRNIFPKLVG